MAPIATSAPLHSIPASIRTRSVSHSSISFGCNSKLANSRLPAFGEAHHFTVRLLPYQYASNIVPIRSGTNTDCLVQVSLGACHPTLFPLLCQVEKSLRCHSSSMYGKGAGTGTIVAAKGDNPPIMPVVTTPDGQLDLSTVLFRNRTIFIGQFISPQVGQRVISQLLTLAAIDESSDILLYLNCNGGSIYSTFAIYDCMKWIKPRVGTVGFGAVASQGALLLAGGEKGMRYAMPNTRVMIHQPQTGCVGDAEAVNHQVNAGIQNRHRIDMMYSAFTGQPLEEVQKYTERDRFFTAGEALDFGLVDALLDTLY